MAVLSTDGDLKRGDISGATKERSGVLVVCGTCGSPLGKFRSGHDGLHPGILLAFSLVRAISPPGPDSLVAMDGGSDLSGWCDRPGLALAAGTALFFDGM